MSVRLRRADPTAPGIARVARGRGFSYCGADGEPVQDAETIARIRGLAIPPAWRGVWICIDPRGHLQATGIDAAGRKQYLYHEAWREHRDRQKFAAMCEFAGALPRVRRTVTADLAHDDLGRERVLACAVRLLDRGLFRIGGEAYAAANESYGLATILRRHVRASGHELLFDYPAKGGIRRFQTVADDDVYAVIRTLRRRRTGPDELLVYRDDGRWVDVRSQDINDYLRAAAGIECSAKDFRTWNATVLAAVALAREAARTRSSNTARERTIRRVTVEVAEQLGNTPAVCRRSYIDPRVFDRFRSGSTVSIPRAARPLDDDRARRRLERSVLRLIA